ncbi:hypothetical protein HUW51_09420 [Adhaeribacter swui]|uniref:Uncharacterized protein n=1 Tax=Adhaeribacter swui TaxID=2086471 RepID=A0A7G7G706_9BACT|nr:hypothetical protein [Adhaeribacter swui]QNF32940.1 hypothetical protein HUW51_09420 [Adhaeribacter swui]
MWVKYNPGWLVALLQEQLPDKVDTIEAAKQCTRGVWEKKNYIYFVSIKNPDLPGSEWQFKENLILEDADRGMVVLDILKDGRIGGIQFVSSEE